MKFSGFIMGLLAASALTACASDLPPQPPGFDGGPGPRSFGSRIFISPAGEPFRPEGSGAAPMRRWFDQADANHDGALTTAEFEADQLRFFAIADSNKDGVITAVEVSRYETQIAPEILAANERPDMQRRPDEAPIPGDVARIPGGRGGGQGPNERMPGEQGPSGGQAGRPGGPDRMTGSGPTATRGGGFIGQTRQGAARYSLLNEPQPLRAADLDYDFKVTRAEWIAASARRFAQLDARRDGRIAFADLRLPEPPREGGMLRRRR